MIVRRTRLRTRVLMITAIYGLLLLSVTFILAWRARSSQKEMASLLQVDVRGIGRLEELMRNQGAFMTQWRSSVTEPSRLQSLVARYGVVTQLLDDRALATEDLKGLRQDLVDFRTNAAEQARRWPNLDETTRTSASRDLQLRTEAIARRAQALTDTRRRQLERRLPELERNSEESMWAALASAYIIVIISFAGARYVVAKIASPLEELARASDRIATGDLSARAPIGHDHEVAILGTSFNRMAAALAASHRELDARARTDELTGLSNFRAFDEAIRAEIGRSSRYGQAFGLLVLDIDHFKKYNDRFGHLAGNDALREVASVVRSAVRTVDFPSRYGGEEFAVIVPQIDAHGLEVTAERIRAQVERLPTLKDRSTVTVSLGGALYPADGGTAELLFASADQRLYRAKHEGRNRAVVPSEQDKQVGTR